MNGNKLFFPILFLFLIIPFSQGLECQYSEIISIERNAMAVYDVDTNQLIGTEDDFVFEGVNNPPNSTSFNIINPFNVDLNIDLFYTYVYREPYTVQETVFVEETIELPALSSVTIFQPLIGFPTDFSILPESISFEFLDNNFVFVGFEFIEETEEVCLDCLGVQCLNDGEVCLANIECGGGYCINGICSNAPVCYNYDCNCDSLTELQCPDNTKCVSKASLPVGATPVCLVEECETGFVDLDGVCSKRDGEICSDSQECGGGYCVRGKCNNLPSCYNNDCECNSLTELQCPDNAQCVLKSFLAIGAMPVCSAEECTTSYVDEDTGLCSVPLPTPVNGGTPLPPADGDVPIQPPAVEVVRNSTLTYVIIGFALIFAAIAVFAIFGFLKAEREKSKDEVKLSKLKFKLKADEKLLKSHGLLKQKKKRKVKKKKSRAKTKAEKEKMGSEVSEQAAMEAVKQERVAARNERAAARQGVEKAAKADKAQK